MQNGSRNKPRVLSGLRTRIGVWLKEFVTPLIIRVFLAWVVVLYLVHRMLVASH
jgi:hypothetical protein